MVQDGQPFLFVKPIKSIAIIGAVLAKAALAEGFTSVRIFEQRPNIGGIWLYTSETSEPPCIPSTDPFIIDPPLKGVPPKFISPMYENLWSNTHRNTMTFAEKEFPDGTPVFPFRTQILQYLKEYASGVEGLVEFNKEVISVKKVGRWRLTIRDLLSPSKKALVEEFDAVAVASGHHNVPIIPSIPGIELFPQDKITHSKYFRHAAHFKNKNILVVGNGPSGADLANQLVRYAKSVQRSVRSEPYTLAVVNSKINDVAQIKQFARESVELEDGTNLTNIDKIIFCTGYLYSLPMFPKEVGLIGPDGAYVRKLYQHTFYTEDPTLAIMGLPYQISAFPTFQNQAIIVAKVWAGKLHLPWQDIMRQEESARLKQKGYNAQKYHAFTFPEDVQLAESWRRWAEEDKSQGCENRMKPWRWTEERVNYRKHTPEIKLKFLNEVDEGKWDHLQL